MAGILTRRKPKQLTREDVTFTGSCPMREHAGDGGYVGRCYFATYEGYCPRHGNVKQFLGEDADLATADDREWPAHPDRDFGSPELRAFLQGPRPN